MSFNFWPKMVRKDDYIIDFINFAYGVKSLLNLKENALLKDSEKKFRNKHKGEDVFIVLNGPSIIEQDLSVLKGKKSMFVNRGFKHPLFPEIKPAYHVIIDPKFRTGEWPLTWIDEIVSMVPDITFVMPVQWAFDKKFIPYIEKGISIMWIGMRKPLLNLGVAGNCFESSIILGFENIYFTGFDGNGLAHELVKTGNTHFYGSNEENNTKDSSDYVRDLYMNSRHFNDLIKFAAKAKKNGHKIYNISHGGIINMFERKDWDMVFNLAEAKK